MIKSGDYFTITRESASEPLCATTDDVVKIASNKTTPPDDQQFIATVNPDDSNQYSFQSVSQEKYMADSNNEAKTSSSSALYYKLTADGDYYYIESVTDSGKYLTADSAASGTKATFKGKKDGKDKSKQKWIFTGVVRED